MQAAAQQTWHVAQDHLRSTLGPEAYNLWLAPVRARAEDHSTLVLEVADKFCEGWLKDNYVGIVQDAVAQASGRQLEIQFEVGSSAPRPQPIALQLSPAPPSKPAPAAEKNISPTESRFNPKNTFDTFVVGNNNNFAYAAALAVAQAPGKSYNPLFLYGGVGLGKTHLLHAIGQHVAEPAKGRARRLPFVRKSSPTNTLTASRTTSWSGSARNTARPTCC